MKMLKIEKVNPYMKTLTFILALAGVSSAFGAKQLDVEGTPEQITAKATIQSQQIAKSRFNGMPGFAPFMVPPVLMPGTSPTGEMKISNTQVTPLIDAGMREYFSRQAEDKAFFENTLDTINTAFTDFLRDIVIGELEQKSNESQADEFVDGKYFVKVLRSKYKTQRAALEFQVKKLEAITSGGLPSAARVQLTENTATDIPAWRNLNTKPIIAYYMNKLKEIDDEVAATLIFKVKDARGQVSPQNLVTLDFSNFSLMSPEEREKQQKIADQKKTLPVPYFMAGKNVAIPLIGQVKNYIKMFGTDEAYRWRDAKDLKAAADQFDPMTDIFLGRSYWRALLGLPTGSIEVNYTKRFAKIEEFLENPSEFSNISDLPLFNEGQVKNNIENSRKRFDLANKRTQSIFNGVFNPLTNLNSAITFIRGAKPAMEAAKQLYELIAADTYEESLMYTSEGQDKFADHYKARYYISDSEKAKIKDKEKLFKAAWAGNSKTSMAFRVGKEGSGSNQSAMVTFYRQAKLFEMTYKEGCGIQDMIDQAGRISENELENARDDKLK